MNQLTKKTLNAGTEFYRNNRVVNEIYKYKPCKVKVAYTVGSILVKRSYSATWEHHANVEQITENGMVVYVSVMGVSVVSEIKFDSYYLSE